MSESIIKAPTELKFICENPTALPTAESLDLEYDGCYKRQKDGRIRALRILDGFYMKEVVAYSKEMSSPSIALRSCSRLSLYYSFWGYFSKRGISARQLA